MNKARRKNILDIVNQLEDLKSTLEDLQGEKEEYCDNIPESLQDSERYEKAEEACDPLSKVVDGLEDIITRLSELTEG